MVHNKNRAIWKQIANINLDRACKKYKNKKHTYKNYHPVKSHGLILMDNSVTKRVVFPVVLKAALKQSWNFLQFFYSLNPRMKDIPLKINWQTELCVEEQQTETGSGSLPNFKNFTIGDSRY